MIAFFRQKHRDGPQEFVDLLRGIDSRATRSSRSRDGQAAEEVGAPWCGWHTLRHTCASILFDDGRNVVQVQRWLGHHKPSFTIDTYVHLLDDDLGAPLEGLGGNTKATDCRETATKDEAGLLLNVAA